MPYFAQDIFIKAESKGPLTRPPPPSGQSPAFTRRGD